ncbi:MAG: 4-(cytidine 5'-diphospho)-2-C-methyl-D-erythritol kinase [Firmicutes bacterium]|nr:4-(cytidine 5'-diphospho)-2-C-methyl-D-erythritol kinase [Bacillota bacterium]
MKEIKVSSFAKINFSIDVTGVLENGMHLVDMMMHQIAFHDDVTVQYHKDSAYHNGQFDIELKTNRHYLPIDERNLAYKAAQLMIEEFGEDIPGGHIRIDIFKRIPVAAGMAGGSGNGAAVLHGLNALWKLNLSLEELCELGSRLGSDIPFCVMGQARGNFALPRKVRKDAKAVSCARATGTGTTMEPLPSVRKILVIAKPNIGVSTKEVYQGIDSCIIEKHPDNDAMAEAIGKKDEEGFYQQCINVLECYTLQAYPKVDELKQMLLEDGRAEKVLMSGSGPTVFAVYGSFSEAKSVCSLLRKQGYEAYWTKTTK